MIFIIKSFQTIVFIFIVISIMFWLICLTAFFRCLSNSETFTELRKLWLMVSEQVTPVDSIKDVVRSSLKVPEFNKHLKKAGGHTSQNIVEITIKMKTIVRKPLLLKISTPITMLLPTTVDIFLSLNCFGHVIRTRGDTVFFFPNQSALL